MNCLLNVCVRLCAVLVLLSATATVQAQWNGSCYTVQGPVCVNQTTVVQNSCVRQRVFPRFVQRFQVAQPRPVNPCGPVYYAPHQTVCHGGWVSPVYGPVVNGPMLVSPSHLTPGLISGTCGCGQPDQLMAQSSSAQSVPMPTEAEKSTVTRAPICPLQLVKQMGPMFIYSKIDCGTGNAVPGYWAYSQVVQTGCLNGACRTTEVGFDVDVVSPEFVRADGTLDLDFVERLNQEYQSTGKIKILDEYLAKQKENSLNRPGPAN